MISIYLIFTTLAATTLAKGSIEINFSETGAQQFFGAVGQQLIFHLPNTANTDIELLKDNILLLSKINKNQIQSLHDEYTNQSALFTNGTFKLGNAMKRHTGAYQLTEYGSNGNLRKKITVHLEIQAPVSKPAVTQMCWSPEQMNISCSAEGDGVEFILTQDDHLLMQTRAHRQSQKSCTANLPPLATNKKHELCVSNVTIGLQSYLTGNFMCQVWNNVSRDETVFQLTDCKVLVSSFPFVTVAVIGSVTLLLLMALCLYITCLNKMRRPTAINEDNYEEEIVYADVRVLYKRETTSNPHQN